MLTYNLIFISTAKVTDSKADLLEQGLTDAVVAGTVS